MDKLELEKELNSVFRLYKACLDKNYLRELCAEKGLLKKANQIIENKKDIVSFKEQYSELLKNNASRYAKISLANKFNNKYLNRISALEYKDEILYKTDLEDLEEEEKELKEELEEIKQESEFRSQGLGGEDTKKTNKLDLGSSAVYQVAFESEIEKAFGGLKWEPNFEVKSTDSKNKIKGAYVLNGTAHLYYGNNTSIRDIGKKIFFKVKDFVNKLGLRDNPSIEPVDIAATVSELIIYGSDTNEGSLIRDIQKKYNEAVSNKELPLNITPYLMTAIESRIKDVLKSKSGFLKKLYDYYQLREKKKENREEIDKLDKNIRNIDQTIKDIEGDISRINGQIKGGVGKERVVKLKKDLKQYEERLKNHNLLRKNYFDSVKDIENINKSISKEIKEIEYYIAKMNDGIEDSTGLAISTRSTDIDSDGEFKDVYESVSKSFNIEDLIDEKILENYKGFKEKFVTYYEDLVNEKLLEIAKSNPNIITKEHIEDFVELAFDEVEIGKNKDGEIINKAKKSIPNEYILEFKDEVIEVTRELIKDIEKGSESKINFDDFIKDAIKKSSDKFKKFVEEILPETLIKDFLEFFEKNKLSTVSKESHELFVRVLNVIFYQKDYEDNPITIRDKQKIIDYFSSEKQEEISDSALKNLNNAVRISLVNFATKSNDIDSKQYPKIIEKLYIWNLLPENSKKIVNMMNAEEKKIWEEDNTYVPERFKSKKNEYEKIIKKQENSDEKDSKDETELNITKTKVNEALKNLESLQAKHRRLLKNKQPSDMKDQIEKAKNHLKDQNIKYVNALGALIQRLGKEIDDLKKFSDKYDGDDKNIINLYKDLIERKNNFLLSVQKEQNELIRKNKIKKEEETDLTVIPKEKKVRKPRKTKASIEDITNYIDVLYSKIL